MTTTDSAPAVNPFLMGPFAPVAEEVTVTDLPVTGTLPASLDGRYLRNGPNPVAADPATYHWFSGDGMVHGIRLRDGRAEWYRNRWVRTAEVAGALGEPRPGTVGAGTVQAPNTNVIGHGGRIYAVAEAGARPVELTGELETVGPCSFGGTLTGGYTAHPHRDPASGELHAVSYFLAARNRFRYEYTVLGADGRVRRTVDLDVAGNPMMHDFALTEDHVVLLDLPVTVDFAQLGLDGTGGWPAAGAGGDGPGVPRSFNPDAGVIGLGWDPEHPARLGVLPRDGGASDVRWFPVGPCYVFHPLNAYEERDEPGGPARRIVVDVVRYPTMFAMDHRGPDAPSTLDRWTVDLAAGTVREERVDDRMQEFPRLDERRTGRLYRYGYTVGLQSGAGGGPALLKHDMVSGTAAVHTFERGDLPTEFVFVPTDGGSGEDDGMLMGLVHRGATGRGDLVVLDAGSLEPLATVHLPVRVPYGFHGNWVPA